MMFDEGIKMLPQDVNEPFPSFQKLPMTPDNVSGIEFLRFYTSQNQPGTPPPRGFFDELRTKLVPPGVKQAYDPSDIDSPETTKAIEEHVREFGAKPINTKQIQENIERLRQLVRGV